MKPVKFSYANAVLKPPPDLGHGEVCDDLPIHRGTGELISCWKPTLRERISLLFGGFVWLGVRSKHSQPAMWLQIERNLFRGLD